MRCATYPPTSLQLDFRHSSYQYFGLAADFRDVVLSGRLDLGHFHPVHIILDGEYVRNIAWDRNAVAGRSRSPNEPDSHARPMPPRPTIYTAAIEGWLARVTVGHPEAQGTCGTGTLIVGYK